jgi:hypothetical protein
MKSGIVGLVKRDLGGRMAALFLDLLFDTKSKLQFDQKGPNSWGHIGTSACVSDMNEAVLFEYHITSLGQSRLICLQHLYS